MTNRAAPPTRRPTGAGRRGPVGKWRDELLFVIYRGATQGHPVAHVAQQCGIAPDTLSGWIKSKPLAKLAWEQGTNDRSQVHDQQRYVSDYVYQQLDPDLQPLWEQLTETDAEGRWDPTQARNLLEAGGDLARQAIYIHALCVTGFDGNKAGQMAQVSHARLRRWRQEQDFLDLEEAVLQAKKNFAENALMDLVVMREAGTVKFVNQTLNADRGYAPKVSAKIEHTGQVNHAHGPH